MNTITSLFQQAQLAEAAYANFIDNTGSLITTDAGVKAALIASGFSSDPNNTTQSAQATAFLTHWQVVDQSPPLGLFGNGFSATLFASLDNPGQYTFSIAGSVLR